MAEEFDLVILGSGSTAFAAALRAAELGKTAVMTESRSLGGTCVNRGCLPSKNLIEVDMLHVYPTMAEALKIVAISRFKDPEKLSCCAE